MTLKKKGTVKKTKERTVPKSRGGSLAVGTFKETFTLFQTLRFEMFNFKQYIRLIYHSGPTQ